MKNIKFNFSNKKSWYLWFINKSNTFSIQKFNQKKPSDIFNEQFANNMILKLLETSTNKKTFDWWVTLTIPSGGANLLPPIGPFLGQHGFNTLVFCNTYNNITKEYPEQLPLKTTIKLFSDKTILFQISTPPTPFLLYSASQLKEKTTLSINDILKIVLLKKIDLHEIPISSLLHSIIGTARSMKIKIKKKNE